MNSIYDLPDINFAEKSATDIESAVITMYEGISGKNLFPGDPVRLFLEAVAAIIIQQRVLIDFSAKQNILKYAKKEYLDHLGSFKKTPRLQQTKAMTTLRFQISTPLNSVVIIPIGTRATPDRVIYFQTTELAEVPIGSTFVDVKAECLEFGDLGNNFLPGQIKHIVNPFPYFQSVSNITTSKGGAEEEDDEAYRVRIFEAPESFSVAGPEGAYIYWARKASQTIVDVSVWSPTPGTVEIIPLTQDAEVTEEILNAVHEKCNQKEVRPLTDLVTVRAPDKILFDVDAVYYIDRVNQTKVAGIQSAVQIALDNYLRWQRSKLGRNINPSELISQIMNAGASRVEVTNPVFTKIELWQVALISNIDLRYGGIDDD